MLKAVTHALPSALVADPGDFGAVYCGGEGSQSVAAHVIGDTRIEPAASANINAVTFGTAQVEHKVKAAKGLQSIEVIACPVVSPGAG